MKSPVFDNIRWRELAVGLVFVGGILTTVLTTAPIPNQWKPWVVVVVAVIGQVGAFLRNPKKLDWDYAKAADSDKGSK